MTFWDNPQMIINHIRHSCVTSDDTGMCEMVIVQDEPEIFQFKQRKRIGGMYTLDEGGDFPDYPSSFDIAVSPGVMGRTPKTHKNDRFRKKPEHHCKTIHWNDQLEDITDGVLKEDMFEEVVLPVEPVKGGRSSLLSQLLEETLYQPSNPYLEFAKFDGEGLDETCSTKTIHFFLPFLLPSADDERGVIITICVIETATVKDVKGLVLCKACLKGKESSIHTDISKYGVWIAEDDGTVDSEFPMLDEKEAISKYGFQFLAVDEKDKDKQNKPSQKNVPVKIFLENNGYSLVKVERMDVKMRIILNKILKKRSLLKKTSMYQLRRESDDHDQFVDLDSTLESTGTMTFHLVKNAQVRSMTKTDERDQYNQYKKAINDEILSTQYKSYNVLLVRGLFASSTEVSLGIHGQKIEIDPVAQIKSHIFSKIKPVSLDVSNIAECEITDDNKTGGRALFRIYFKKSEDFKHYEFEASRHVANEIVSKIYNILKSRSQLVRAEFLNTKEKKGGKAKSR